MKRHQQAEGNPVMGYLLAGMVALLVVGCVFVSHHDKPTKSVTPTAPHTAHHGPTVKRITTVRAR